MAGINQGRPEVAVGEPIRFGDDLDFEIEQHPISDRLIIRDTANGKEAYVRAERGGQIGGDGVLIKALKESKPMADDGRVYETIQEAERQASSWVFVPPGNYNENVVITTKGLTLKGNGYSTVVTSDADDVIKSTASNVTIENVSVEGTGTDTNGISVSGIYNNIYNCRVIDSIRFGLYSISRYSTISNCIIEDNQDQAIVINENGIVNSNRILQGASRGIADGGNLGESIYANNIVKDTGDNSLYANQPNQLIIGNRVINSGSNGIEVVSDNCIIANNRVSDSASLDIDDSGTDTLLDANLTGGSN